MKKITKPIAIALLLLILLVPMVGGKTASSQISASAQNAAAVVESREEVIYANLDAKGRVKEINAVNILNVSETGKIEDFGNFTLVRNLTDTAVLTIEGDKIIAEVQAGRFYYQGTMKSTDLPWIINISHYLDGVEIAPSELAGKTGNLLIRLKTQPNDKIDPLFFENYILQITITLNATLNHNIATDGGGMANVANAGQNRLITFTVMPGEDGEVSVSADVVNFEMPSIEIAALPLSIRLEAPDTSEMKEELKYLSDAIASLNDGVNKLAEGAHDISSGAGELEKGSQSFNEGLADLNAGSADLVGASRQINEALSTIAASLRNQTQNSDVGSLAELPAGLTGLASGIDEISKGLSGLNEGFVQSHGALSLKVAEIPGNTLPPQELTALYMANPNKKELIDQLVGFYTAAQKVKGTYEAVRPAFEALETNLNSIIESHSTISASLRTIAAQTEVAMQANDTLTQIEQLSLNMSTLSEEFGLFHKGLVSYTQGLDSLANSYAYLHGGITEISGGTGELHEGVRELYEGTTKLKDETRSMPEQFESEVDKMIDQFDKSDFMPLSFVSPENERTAAVQFVMRTEAIEISDAAADAEPAIKRPDFWARFLNLFRLLREKFHQATPLAAAQNRELSLR